MTSPLELFFQFDEEEIPVKPIAFRNLLSEEQIEDLTGEELVAFRERYKALSDEYKFTVQSLIQPNMTNLAINDMFNNIESNKEGEVDTTATQK